MSVVQYTIATVLPQGIGDLYRLQVQLNTSLSHTQVTQIDDDSITLSITYTVAPDAADDIIINNVFAAFVAGKYATLASDLSDARAVQVEATDVNGGIYLKAGIGGIAAETTNSINLDAGAASRLTTSLGNILLSPAGLLNLGSASGINVGTDNAVVPINIGTDFVARDITVGTGNTAHLTQNANTVATAAGSGGYTIATTNGPFSVFASGASSNVSLDTSADGQNLFVGTTGTHDVQLQLAGSGTGARAIALSAPNGGATIECGAQGWNVTSAGGVGLAATGSSSIAMTTGTGGMSVSAGAAGVSINAANGGVIFIGNNDGGGQITLGASTTDRQVILGNLSWNSSLILRNGALGLWQSQRAETALSDADTTLTIADIMTAIITQTPTVLRTLTFPTAASIIAYFPWFGLVVNDAIDFTIINLAALGTMSIAIPAEATMVGNGASVPALSSRKYRLRMTNVTASSEAYTVYVLS